MKKVIYTVALLLAASAAQAQAPIKHTQEEFADVTMLGDDLLLYTKKESQGQYLYREAKGGEPVRDAQLNAGTVNAVVGGNPATGELYVYQQRGRRDRRIAVYKFEGGGFTKTEELDVPRFRNNSENLGMHLNEDKNRLIISGELSRSEGYDDLYLSRREGGKWGRPERMGGGVNSRQAEFAPFLASDSLFFSRREGNAAYVYAVPVRDGQPSGEPVRLEGAVNQQDAFNAYYKRVGGRELWVSSRAGDYFAYLSEPAPAEEAVAVAEKAVETPAAPVAQTLFFGFNEVYMGAEAEGQLRAFLEAQRPGATVAVKGFSDARGPVKGREKVSRQRAAFVAWYIQDKFADKNFTVQTDSRVLGTEGQEARRVELQVK